MVLKTQMGNTLGVADASVMDRAELFNDIRDNRGLMILNKETEEFANVAAPLSGLEALQAQAQEHMAAIPGIPLVKFFGLQPAGLNA
ncbi:anti-CBASS protein Acb1 family protein, partial [Klebsiella pneumoniae]|uniref:anti-CBASS protein Acb1 family protein n=1 Tax=Klebsiella pneumoniae TaxID=573 RepID=UPI001F5D1710